MGEFVSGTTKYVEKLSFKDKRPRRVDYEGANDSLREK